MRGDEHGRELHAVARALAAAWTDGDAPAELPELTLADGYITQAAVVAALDSPVIGYRIVASSARSRERLGTDGPVVGVVTDQNLTRPGTTPHIAPRVVEAEFAVDVDLRLDEPADPPRILAWHLSLDLPRSRVTDEWATLGAGQLVADVCLLGDVVVGAGTEPADARDLAAGTLVVTTGGTDEAHPLPAPDPETTARHLALVKEAVLSGLVPSPATATPFVQLGTEMPLRLSEGATSVQLTHPTLGRLDLAASSHLTGDRP